MKEQTTKQLFQVTEAKRLGDFLYHLVGVKV